MLQQFKAALAENNRTRLTLLLDEIDPDETDDAGNTALHLAAEQADEKMIQELLIRGCDPFAVNRYGWTALHSLVRYPGFLLWMKKPYSLRLPYPFRALSQTAGKLYSR